MIKFKNRIKKIGAGIIASLCAVSLFSTSVGGTLSVSAAMTTENIAFPTADEVIAEAATLLGAPYGWGYKGYTGVYYQGSYTPLDLDYVRNQGVDCSGLLYYTLTHLGYSTSGFSWNNPVPVDTPHWLSVNDNCTITYKGVTSKIDVEKSNIPCTKHPYWECSDGSTISAGSMVIAQNPKGEDHSWIYMGEFDSRNDVISYLKSIGVNESYISSRTVGDGNGDGGTHWRIESNGSEGCVINNRTDGKSSTALNMSAFRVTQNDVKFNITKVLSTDNSVKISGISSIDGSKAIYGVYTDKNCSQKVGEITIGADGTGSIKLPNKHYYVKEISAPKGYDLSPDVVPLKANGNVNVEEDITSGKITVNKTAEDGVVADREFQLTWTDGGKKHSKTAVTDEKGIAEFDGLHVYDFSTKGVINYTVSEVNTDSKYVAQKPQDVTLTRGNADLTVGVKFENRLKKFKAEVKKNDSENITAQGDATLSGAVYGLYRDGERIATYTTDENGHFITDEFICGNYTLQELKPSQGYQLNDTIYKVGAEPEMYVIETNTIALDVTEDIIKGRVSILKHSDDEDDTINNLESNAEFQVYLKSAGSYESASETERDYLITDKNGIAKTKDLPYGTYTVHQTKTVNDAEFFADFDVNIFESEKTYEYILNNKPFKSYIHITKVDAETGNVIPYEGAGFRIYDDNGNPVNLGVEVFYTNNDGYLITPEAINYGKYTLVEVQAPYGYVLDSTPVPFMVSESNVNEENAVRIIKVTKADKAQKGKISVSKRGDVFKSVIAVGDKYTPVFEERGLSGAEFEVKAAEDIYTPDGTLRASNGDVVADLITNENGYTVTGDLYLGKYIVSEKKAPVGYVLNSEEKLIELTYAGQEVAVADAVNTIFINDYQSVDIHLKKIMEHDEKFGISDKNEYKNVTFGLFAAEDITAADGTVIPENGLISIVTLGEDMNAHFEEKLPFAKYYVEEISTDESYMLNGEKYLVNFKYMGQAQTTVDIDCGTFVNDLKRGSVSGIKVNEKNEPLEKAVFGLFSTDTNEFIAENALIITESDKDGKFSFTDIPYGKYIVSEIAAPKGYYLSDKLYPVDISEDGDVVEITAENRPVSVSIRKTDIYGKELTGAKMRLINKNGDIIDEWTSGNDSHIINNITADEYTLKEIAAPDGYVIATDIRFTIDENGIVTVNGVKTNAYNADGVPCITMVDNAIDKPVTPPSTGDTGRSPLGLAMIIAGLCGVFYVSHKYRKKEKETDSLGNEYADLCPYYIESTKK
ncbi:SpaA isopeptide-forming pilin-related protein [Ruminococcus sp.]|uniref:SpaA isopeptide-forming pilin-related protein n=1 Tax=Ruminococcus sp. TaxID=41978 RepID=UPI0025D659C6|nr:SpaA isopeptide-forming pilin-related protein [Ruminococcus sp.]